MPSKLTETLSAPMIITAMATLINEHCGVYEGHEK